MKGKKSWIDLLDEKEKGYLKWLLILTCVGSATIIILNYFFDINIHIQKYVYWFGFTRFFDNFIIKCI